MIYVNNKSVSDIYQGENVVDMIYKGDKFVFGKGISVTKQGEHCSGGANTAEYGAPYNATITPAFGYAVISVAVSMGGTDITSTAYNAETGALSIASVTGAITITVQTSEIIVFEDANVKAICVTNWGGGYVNDEITAYEAAAVTTIGGQFRNNNNITKFNEFRYFTGVTSIPNSSYTTGLFASCQNLEEVMLPPLTGVNTFMGMFYDCKKIEYVDLTPLARGTSVSVNIHSMFRSSSIKEVDLRPFKKITTIACAFLGTTGVVRLTKIITTGCDFSAMTADSSAASAFSNTYTLNHIEGGFSGLRVSLDLHACPLTVASATEVLTSLGNPLTTSKKITFKANKQTTYEADTDFNAAVVTATGKGWAIAYA